MTRDEALAIRGSHTRDIAAAPVPTNGKLHYDSLLAGCQLLQFDSVAGSAALCASTDAAGKLASCPWLSTGMVAAFAMRCGARASSRRRHVTMTMAAGARRTAGGGLPVPVVGAQCDIPLNLLVQCHIRTTARVSQFMDWHAVRARRSMLSPGTGWPSMRLGAPSGATVSVPAMSACPGFSSAAPQIAISLLIAHHPSTVPALGRLSEAVGQP
jgi:hypothetical protein